jgi:hypothetical protein
MPILSVGSVRGEPRSPGRPSAQSLADGRALVPLFTPPVEAIVIDRDDQIRRSDVQTP